MIDNIKKTLEKIYIIQPILAETAHSYSVLHDEAIALIESAGAVYAGTIYQNIREINTATYIGAGKLLELKERLEGLEEITVLFNGELSPSQTQNISTLLDHRKVIDRTTLILDIFAKNAQTNEGKLQVELAQLRYLYPRLKGKGVSLSRLGGGVGTRGPGETQLETDRRYIRARIQHLERRLKEVEKRRDYQFQRRKKDGKKTIALVGYTNTGKSTLMNLLTNSDVYVQNQLFATLDPTARTFYVEGVEFLLIDTVGFLQNLPHDLIKAFHSTLESALRCDLALIVCDATGEYDMQLRTTLNTLSDLGFCAPYLVVMNKSENIQDTSLFPRESIMISAKENLGIDQLRHQILAKFQQEYLFCRLFVAYNKLPVYAKIKEYATEKNISYTDDGQYIDVVLFKHYIDKFQEFVVEKMEFPM